MPLTAKGERLLKAFKDQYGARGEEVFYRAANAGTITGVHEAQAKKPRPSMIPPVRKRR